MHGSVILTNSSSHHYHNALIVEAFAILETCKLIFNAKIKNALFEADSLNTIFFIYFITGASYWSSNVIIDEIKFYWYI